MSGVVLALVWWGGRLTGELFDRTYLAAPAWLWKLVPWPLAFLPLGWTVSQGTLALLNARSPGRPWAVWTRRGILAILAVWLLAMLPMIVLFIRGTLEVIAQRNTPGMGVSFSMEIPFNPFMLFTTRHSNLLPPLGFLAGVLLGLLGFPARRKLPEA